MFLIILIRPIVGLDRWERLILPFLTIIFRVSFLFIVRFLNHAHHYVLRPLNFALDLFFLVPQQREQSILGDGLGFYQEVSGLLGIWIAFELEASGLIDSGF
jgi:hypothetical protein